MAGDTTWGQWRAVVKSTNCEATLLFSNPDRYLLAVYPSKALDFFVVQFLHL